MWGDNLYIKLFGMLNTLLKFWSDLVEIIKTFPVKARIQIVIIIIAVCTISYITVKIFTHQENILRINSDREIRLAEINLAQADSSNNFKRDGIPQRGHGIENKLGRTIPNSAGTIKK